MQLVEFWAFAALVDEIRSKSRTSLSFTTGIPLFFLIQFAVMNYFTFVNGLPAYSIIMFFFGSLAYCIDPRLDVTPNGEVCSPVPLNAGLEEPQYASNTGSLDVPPGRYASANIRLPPLHPRPPIWACTSGVRVKNAQQSAHL